MDGVATGDGLYLRGEEKFGPLSSRIYGFFSSIRRWSFYSDIVNHILSSNPRHILDIGCGPANLLIMLSKRSPDLRCVGIDPSPSMVKLARKRVERERLSDRIGIMIGSSRNIPVSGKFDTIITSFSFHHWQNKNEGLQEILSHLETGGKLTIYDLSASGLYGKIPMIRNHVLDHSTIEIDPKVFSKKVEYSRNGALVFVNITRRDISRNGDVK